MALRTVDLTQQPHKVVFTGCSQEEVNYAKTFWQSLQLLPPMESRLVSSDIKQRLRKAPPSRSMSESIPDDHSLCNLLSLVDLPGRQSISENSLQTIAEPSKEQHDRSPSCCSHTLVGTESLRTQTSMIMNFGQSFRIEHEDAKRENTEVDYPEGRRSRISSTISPKSPTVTYQDTGADDGHRYGILGAGGREIWSNGNNVNDKGKKMSGGPMLGDHGQQGYFNWGEQKVIPSICVPSTHSEEEKEMKESTIDDARIVGNSVSPTLHNEVCRTNDKVTDIQAIKTETNDKVVYIKGNKVTEVKDPSKAFQPKDNDVSGSKDASRVSGYKNHHDYTGYTDTSKGESREAKVTEFKDNQKVTRVKDTHKVMTSKKGTQRLIASKSRPVKSLFHSQNLNVSPFWKEEGRESEESLPSGSSCESWSIRSAHSSSITLMDRFQLFIADRPKPRAASSTIAKALHRIRGSQGECQTKVSSWGRQEGPGSPSSAMQLSKFSSSADKTASLLSLPEEPPVRYPGLTHVAEEPAVYCCPSKDLVHRTM